MIVVCEPGPLGAALKTVASIVNKTDAVPIMANLLIETVGTTHIRITATDLEKRVSRTIAAQVEREGACTVAAARFTAVVGAFDGQVKLTAEDKLSVVSGRSRLLFGTLPAAMFPAEQDFVGQTAFTAGEPFVKAMALTRHAHGSNEVQSYAHGTLLTDRSGMELTALDGQRMAMVNLGGKGVPNAIIPSAAVDLILRLADGEFRVELSDRAIRCDFGMTVLTAKLIDVQYPDYSRFVDMGDLARKVHIGADDLRAALGRMALMADDKDRKVRLAFDRDKVTLSIDTSVDQAVEEVPCDYAGEPFVKGFRSQYLRDALVALDVDDVELGMEEPMGAPMRITSAQRPGVTLIAMPISV